jgi:hypothetical protein
LSGSTRQRPEVFGGSLQLRRMPARQKMPSCVAGEAMASIRSSPVQQNRQR